MGYPNHAPLLAMVLSVLFIASLGGVVNAQLDPDNGGGTSGWDADDGGWTGDDNNGYNDDEGRGNACPQISEEGPCLLEVPAPTLLSLSTLCSSRCMPMRCSSRVCMFATVCDGHDPVQGVQVTA